MKAKWLVIMVAVLLGGLGLLYAGVASLIRVDQSSTTQFRPAEGTWYLTPLGSPIVGEQVGLAEAQVRVPFQAPLPSYVPNSAALAEVWASPKDVKPSMRSLAFVYSNGLTIIIHQEDEATNWEALATPPFTLININGHAGVGKDPGKEEVMGEWYDYPGSVSWQVGRFQISVYSQYHSMEELIRVAKSMEIR